MQRVLTKEFSVYAYKTQLMIRCDMGREKCIMEIFFRWNRYVFVDMHLADAIRFQNTISNVLCLVSFSLSTDYNNLFYQKVSTEIPVSFR